jgi:hypothetical protein
MKLSMFILWNEAFGFNWQHLPAKDCGKGKGRI